MNAVLEEEMFLGKEDQLRGTPATGFAWRLPGRSVPRNDSRGESLDVEGGDDDSINNATAPVPQCPANSTAVD